MTYVVTEACVKCKYTDCVNVCPVDCFKVGPNFLVIDPDECIDCAVCVPECPVDAIYAEEDLPPDHDAAPRWGSRCRWKRAHISERQPCQLRSQTRQPDEQKHRWGWRDSSAREQS